MFHRLAPALLIAVAALYSSGCVCTHSSLHGPGIGCNDCGVAACEPGCGCGAGCSSGCGEVYWGEWTNHPPDCCDPCDNYGNYVGDACCDPCCTPWSPWRGLLHLWGYRYTPACGVACGCGGCDNWGGGMYVDEPMYMQGEMSVPVESKGGETLILPQPEPEAAPTTAASYKRHVKHARPVRAVRR
jgi:hypothetical protein